MVIKKFKELGEHSDLAQSQKAIYLKVDTTTMMNKTGWGAKSSSNAYISKLSELFRVSIETIRLSAKHVWITKKESHRNEVILMLLEDLKADFDGNK